MFSLGPISRRKFILLSGAAGAYLAASGCSKQGKDKVEIATAVELMEKQHGILRRALFILDEVKGGMDARMELPPEIIQGTIEVVRRIVVECHQKIEDESIFPLFESAKKMGGLVGVLREQHAAGTQMIGILGQFAADFSVKDLEKRRTMQNALHHFSRMYRAHSDREDTQLFPALRQIVSPADLTKLNETVQKLDLQILGQNGYDEAMAKLEGFENALGMGDLAAFTPHMDELR